MGHVIEVKGNIDLRDVGEDRGNVIKDRGGGFWR